MGEGDEPKDGWRRTPSSIRDLMRDFSSRDGRPTSPIPAAGTLIGGRWRLGREIGSGGMGRVFRATEVDGGRPVAIKLMREQSRAAQKRFNREEKAVSRIRHANVVEVYDYGIHERAPYLVMELLDGVSMAAYLRRRWRRGCLLSPAELAVIVVPLLEALAVAHRARVIHRDIKPENIVLCRSGAKGPIVPKLLDFGIAKVLDMESLTAPGGTPGTVQYMSPEQHHDSPTLDARSDIFSVGVLMYEALSGRLPFVGDGYFAIRRAVLKGKAVRLKELRPDLPAPLERAVMRALAKAPAQRFQSAAELILALSPWLPEMTEGGLLASQPGQSAAAAGLAWDTTLPQRPVVGTRRRWLAAAAGCAVACGLSAGTLVRVTGGEGMASRSSQALRSAPAPHTNERRPPIGRFMSLEQWARAHHTPLEGHWFVGPVRASQRRVSVADVMGNASFAVRPRATKRVPVPRGQGRSRSATAGSSGLADGLLLECFGEAIEAQDAGGAGVRFDERSANRGYGGRLHPTLPVLQRGPTLRKEPILVEPELRAHRHTPQPLELELGVYPSEPKGE